MFVLNLKAVEKLRKKYITKQNIKGNNGLDVYLCKIKSKSAPNDLE